MIKNINALKNDIQKEVYLPQKHVKLDRVLELIDEYNTSASSIDLEHRRVIQREQTKEYQEEQYEKYKAELGLND